MNGPALGEKRRSTRRASGVPGTELKKLWDAVKLEVDRLRTFLRASSSGFSATGRANNIPAVKAGGVSMSFLKGVTFDGKAPVWTGDKRKEFAQVKDAAGPLSPYWIAGDGESNVSVLKRIDGAISKSPREQSIDTTRGLVAKERGLGQLSAMAACNAQTYAKFVGVPGWAKSRWEWLHLRAASLGGVTDGSNLVLGTRDANTHMMVYEANLKLLAGMLEGHSKYGQLKANFTFERGDKVGNYRAKHHVSSITISWAVEPRAIAAKGLPKRTGEVTFKTTDTSVSLSKEEVKKLQTATKEYRSFLVSAEPTKKRAKAL
jgi:hypothetical protein